MEAFSVEIVQNRAADIEFENLSSRQQFNDAGSIAYPLSHLAVAGLFDRQSIDAATDYFRQLSAGTPFDTTVYQVFGIELDDYYSWFPSWLESAQGSREVPAALSVSFGVDKPSSVSIVDDQEEAARGEQILVLATTSAAANCVLLLRQPAVEEPLLRRETFADGKGGVFWLVTIPWTISPGPALLDVSCGADPEIRTITVE